MARRGYAALLTLLLLAGCTGGHPSAGPAADEGPGEIVVASGRDVTGKSGIREQLIAAWNDQQRKAGSGYRARLVELPGNADEQRSQLLGALQSGSADYDVVNLDVTWVPEFAAAHLVRPLPDGTVDADVIKSVAETARWDGKVYAAPFNSDVGLLYYRTDLMKKAQVSQPDLNQGISWARLQELSRAVRQALPDVAGWTTQLGAYEGRTVNAIEAFASADPDFELTDDDGHYDASVGKLTAGIAELRSRTDPSYTLPAAFQSDEADSLGDFADGRTEFLRQWPYAYRAPPPVVRREPARGGSAARSRGARRAEPRGDRVVQAGGQGGRADHVPHRQTKRTLPAGRGVRGHPHLRLPGQQRDLRRRHRPDTVGLPTGERTDSMPRDAAGRPAYARTTLLPALRKAVQRPRTPLYGAFTQTFTAQLGPLFRDDPPSDATLAKRLDTALKKALPN